MKEPLHIIKIGGKLINDKNELDRCLKGFKGITGKKILVHGGGRKATEISQGLNIPVSMIDGRRITDAATLEVAIMVYAGLINKQIASSLQAIGVNAIGMAGCDGNIIKSEKRPVGQIDYGYVGDVQKVNGELLKGLLQLDLLPVLCPLTHDGKSQLLNTNADTIAAEVAISLSNYFDVTLQYCFEYPGVMRDIKDQNSLISNLGHDEFQKMISDGSINSGMIPKLTNGFHALSHGVNSVMICNIDNLQSKTISTSLQK